MDGRMGRLAILLVLTLTVKIAHAQTCSSVDSAALKYFQLEIVFGGEEFKTWVDGTNCCNWDGVICSSAGRVLSLNVLARDVQVNRPSGQPYTVGTAIGDLSEMTNLTLLNVAFNGQMPALWGTLSKLQVLNIDGCNVVGSIPAEFCKLTNLNTLILKGNLLSGSVPSCISKANLPLLRSLDLSGNSGLSQPIPSIP